RWAEERSGQEGIGEGGGEREGMRRARAESLFCRIGARPLVDLYDLYGRRATPGSGGPARQMSWPAWALGRMRWIESPESTAFETSSLTSGSYVASSATRP